MTSLSSSEFLYNTLNVESVDNIDLSSDIKLEESSTNTSLIGKKRKLHVKPEPYKISDSSECLEPPSKKMRLDTTSNSNSERIKPREGSKDDEFNFPDLEIPDSTNNSSSKPNSTTSNNSHCHPTNTSNNYGLIGGSSVSPHHPPYLLPVVPPPHPHYFMPIVPHHMPHPMSPYGHHSLPFPPHMNPYHNPYGQYHHHHHHQRQEKVKVQNDKNTKKRKRKKKKKMDETSDETNSSELLDDEIVSNNKLMTDKSPFKTTYISREEEIELKNTNNTLYSQFHHARQAIYQQYKQKSQAIRHSNVLTQEKRKLNMKVAAIDAKVQEKKLFLTLSMNAFARKITHQTNTKKKKKKNANKEEISKQKEEKPKQATTAKRVKKPKFSEYNVRVLRDWYETHTNNPYPSSSEKHLMCQLTGLTKYQVSRWFCNVRTRKPPPELSDNDEDIIQNMKRKNGDSEYNDYYAHHPHPLAYPPHPLALHPLNLPPMHAHAMSHFNFNHAINVSNDNSEGLMPSINSDFNLMPPPLIDEDSGHQT
eukprot:1067857_1